MSSERLLWSRAQKSFQAGRECLTETLLHFLDNCTVGFDLDSMIKQAKLNRAVILAGHYSGP